MDASCNNDDLLRVLSDAEAEAASLELLSLITDYGVGAGENTGVSTSVVSAAVTRNASDEAFAQLELDGDADVILSGDPSFFDDAGGPAAVTDGCGSDTSTGAGVLGDVGVISRATRGLGTSAAATTSRAKTSAALEANGTARTHWKRTKDELEYLRKQVQELEQRLEGLQTHSAAPDRGGELSSASSSPQSPPDDCGTGECASNDLDQHTAAPSETKHMWKRIAKTQLSEKQKAEVENQKLRHALESQLKIAQSLSKLLRKRPDVSWLDSHQLGHQKKLRIDAQTGERNVFEELSEHAETLFSQLDGVFLDAGLTNLNAEMQNGAIKSDDRGSMFLEVIDCKVVPFDVHTTADAVWKVLSKPSIAVSNGVYQALDASETTLRAEFSVTVRLRRSTALLHMQIVFKRIIEASRVVFLWCSEGSSEGSLLKDDLLNVRESGWTLIGQVTSPVVPRDSQTAGAATTTVMKSVVRMTPQVEHSSSSKSFSHVGVFTDIVLGDFHQNLTILHQNIENLILSEQLLRASG